MIESEFSKDLQASLDERQVWNQSFEQCTMPGVPDLLVHDKLDIWLELKIMREGGIHMEPGQAPWNVDYARAGGFSFIVAMSEKSGVIYCWKGASALALKINEKDARAVNHTTFPRINQFIEQILL